MSSFNSHQLPGTLSIDTGSIVNSSACVVYVRNLSDSILTIDSAYINGVASSGVTNVTINAGAVEVVRIDGSFTDGVKYSFKLVANDNTQLLFNLKAEY